MNEEIDRLIAYPIVHALAFFSVAVLALIVFLAIFEFVTKYDNWQEIKQGNLAVAMATGGKIFGICNVFRFAMLSNESIYHALIWSCLGFFLLLAAYFIFEFLTPMFKIDEEIQKGNRAVGFIAMIISISMSYVIGASVQ